MADRVLADRLAAFPAVMITGPRGCGKSTTAARHAAQVVSLDEPSQGDVFRGDPDAALREVREPVLLDEWQDVPEVLGAVKRSVDRDPHPGRFILAGSARAVVDQRSWPATGRVVTMRMYGLTEREINGIDPGGEMTFLEKLASADLDAIHSPDDAPDIAGYMEMALRSGFPQAVLRVDNAADRETWIASYIEHLLQRDVTALSPRRDPVRFGRYFEAVAASTAGIVSDVTIYHAAGINAKTAAGYESLLSSLFVCEAVPAYGTSRIATLARMRKRYFVDPALAAGALGIGLHDVFQNADLLGRFFDTLVMAQLRPEAALMARPPRICHLRDKDGRHEVDVLIELGGGRVAAIECKATASPKESHVSHLQWLRDELGDRFLAGLVVHSGRHVRRFGDRIAAVPLCALWNGVSGKP